MIASCFDIRALAERIVQDDEYVALDKEWLTVQRLMNGNTYTEQSTDKTYIVIGSVSGKLNMPAKGEHCSISWASDSESIIASDGTIRQRTYLEAAGEDSLVTLKAALSYGNAAGEKTFYIIVPPLAGTDAEKKVLQDCKALSSYLNSGYNNVYLNALNNNISLPTIISNLPTASGEGNGSAAAWESSDPGLLSIGTQAVNGYVMGTVNRPTYTQGDKTLTRRARVSQSETVYKDLTFDITVKAMAPDGSESVEYVKNALTYELILNGDNRDNVKNDLNLPTVYNVPGEFGTKEYKISWTSSDLSVVTAAGKIIRPDGCTKAVTLTANILDANGSPAGTKEFTFTVAAKEKSTLALNFEDFANSGDILRSNGKSAINEGGSKALSFANTGSGGSIFTKNKIHLNDDLSFSTAFSFSISADEQFGNYGNGGFTFTLQSDSSTAYYSGGDDKDSLGVRGVKPSVSIAFDTEYYKSQGPGQGNTYNAIKSLGVFVNGNVGSLLQTSHYSTPYHLDLGAAGTVNYAWIEYDGASETMEIRVTKSQVRPVSPTYKLENVNLASMLAADNNLSVGDVRDVYAGFTGSAGDMTTETDDILSWYFKNDSAPIDFDHYTYIDASVISMTATPNAETGDCTLNAKVSGIDGAAAEGVTVAFSVSSGALKSSSATTDSSGTASVIMHTADSMSGVKAQAVAQGGMTSSLDFSLALTEQDVVSFDKAWLTDDVILGGNSALSNVISDLLLPTEGNTLFNDGNVKKKSTIVWSSTNAAYLTGEGKVTNPSPEIGNQTVTLTATITLNTAQATKEFTVMVKSTDAADVNSDSGWLDTAILNGNSAPDNIRTNLNLPTTGQYGSSISWVSSDEAVVKTDGTVTNPKFVDGDKKVVLTAAISKGTATFTKQIKITVKTVDASDDEAVYADASRLETAVLNGNVSLDCVTTDLVLPTAGQNGSTIVWSSSDAITVSVEGKVTRPAYLDGDKSVMLTATLKKGEISCQKAIKVIVKRLDGKDSDRFEEDVNWVDAYKTLGANLSQYSIYLDLTLPDKAPNGSLITWVSSNISAISDDGRVTRPEYNEKNAAVTMTATISGLNNTKTKEIQYTVLSKPDIYPPEVTGSDPANGSTDVSRDAKKITVTFNENIKAGSTNSTNYGITLKGGSINSDYAVSIDGANLIVSLAYWSYGENYKLTIPRNAITDMAGNPMANDYILSFTVETAIRKELVVASSSPSDGSKDFLGDSISLSFSYDDGSEIMDSTNLHASGSFDGIYLKKRDGGVVKITRTLTGNKVTVSPADGQKLEPGCVYTLFIPWNAVADRFFNSNRARTIQFAVASSDATPEVSAVYPANGQTGVNVNQYFTVTFSENVKNGYGGIALYDNSNSNPVTNNVGVYVYWLNDRQCILRPRTVLKPGTSYTLAIGYNFVEDSSSHPMLGDYATSFTTGSNALGIESVSPRTMSWNTKGAPIDAAVNISLASQAQLSEKATQIKIMNASGSSVDFQTKLSGSTAILTPSSLLNAGESYTVYVPEGAFKSESGAVNDAITFSFVTGSKVSLDSYDSFAPYPSDNWVVNKAMSFKTDSLATALRNRAGRTIRSCSWNFGDGAAGSGNCPEHTYTSAGSYTVTLSAVDDYGFTYEISRTVKIGSLDSNGVSLYVSPNTNESLVITDRGIKYKLYTVWLSYENTYVPDEKVKVYLYQNGVMLKSLGTVTTGNGSKTITDEYGYKYSDNGKALFDFWFAGNNYLGTYELVFTCGDADTGKTVRVPVTIVDGSSAPALTIKLFNSEDGTYYEEYPRLCFELDGKKVNADKKWINKDIGYCYVIDEISTGYHRICLSSSGNAGLLYYSDASTEYHMNPDCPAILTLKEKKPGINLITSSDGSSSDDYRYKYYIDDVEMPETTFTIDGDWNDLVAGYYELKVSGSEGDRYKEAFSSPSISLNLPKILNPGEKLYFRMVSPGGKIASNWTDARVMMTPRPEDGSTVSYNAETKSYDVKAEFKLEEMLEETPNIFKNIPFLGKDKNLAELSKKVFTVTAFNVNGKSRFIKYEFPEELAEMSSKGLKFPVQISGKIVLEYNESSNKWELYYGYITLKRDSTLKSSGEKDITIPVVNVSVTGELTLSLVLGGTLALNESDDVDYKYGGILYVAPNLNGSVSAGVGKYKVSCFTDANISSQIHTTGYMSLRTTVKIGVRAKAWLISKTLFELALVDKEWNNGGIPILKSASSMGNGLSNQPAELMPRNYLQRGPEWNAEKTAAMLKASALLGAEKPKTMKSNIFPDSETLLVRSGDELWMIWTDDNPQRSSMNRTQLMYSIYKNGSWSNPAWIGTDATADFSPTAAATEKGVLMAWENMGAELPDSTEASSFAANSEISVTRSEFTSGGGQLEIVTLTKDDKYDHSPKLAAGGKGALLVWTKSEELSGTCFDSNTPQKNTDRLYYSYWNGESWLPASEIEGSLPTVVDSSLAMNGGEGLLLYTLDKDGNLTTTADRELYARSWKDGSWGKAEKLADTAENPRATYLNGDWFITWNQDGDVMYQTGIAAAARNSGLQAGKDYEIAASNGMIALVYREIGDNNSKSLSAAFYDTNTGVWSGETALTEVANAYVQSFSPVFTENGKLSVAYTQADMVTEAIDGAEYQVPSDKVDLKKLDYTLEHNLALCSDDGLGLDPELPLAGTGDTVTVTILNKGDFTENATVCLYDGDPSNGGALVAQSAAKNSIAAHSSGKVTFNWQVNPLKKDKYELYAVVKADDGISESDMSDNSVSRTVSAADAEITNVECTNVANDNYLVRATVYNKGGKDLTNVSLTLTCAGKTLGTATIDELYSGEKTGVSLVFSSKDLKANASGSFDMLLTAALADGENDNSPDNNKYEFTAEPASIVVIGSYPAQGDKKIDVNQKLRVTFNLDASEGAAFNQIVLRDESLNEVEISKTLSGGTLTITPNTALNYDTEYTLKKPAGAVKDSYGHVMHEDCVISFGTASSSPEVVYSYPGDNMKALSVDSKIKMKYNQSISAGPSFEKISLCADTKAVSATATIDGEWLYVNTDGVLEKGTEYSLVIPTGSVVNSSHGIQQEDYTLTFATEGTKDTEDNQGGYSDDNTGDGGSTVTHQTLSDGSVAAVISVDSDTITRAESSGGGVATINVTSQVTNDASIRISLTKAAEDRLVSENTALRIVTGRGDIIIPAAWFASLHEEGRDSITLTITPMSGGDSSDGLVSSGVFNFTLTAGGRQITELGQNFIITIPLDKARVKNSEKVVARTRRGPSDAWRTLGGTVNDQNATLTFRTNHFSYFAAFESPVAFDDVTSDWAKNEVETLASRGLINGTSDGTFNPSGNITRAEFTALIARSLYTELSESKGTFADVPPDSWYSGAVQTAYDLGLVTGSGESTFSPDKSITREQLATIAYRLYRYKNGKAAEYAESTFTDSQSVSEYARAAVNFVQNTGIMKGSDSMFYPKRNTTRQEAAVVLYRLLKYMGEI